MGGKVPWLPIKIQLPTTDYRLPIINCRIFDRKKRGQLPPPLASPTTLPQPTTDYILITQRPQPYTQHSSTAGHRHPQRTILHQQPGLGKRRDVACVAPCLPPWIMGEPPWRSQQKDDADDREGHGESYDLSQVCLFFVFFVFNFLFSLFREHSKESGLIERSEFLIATSTSKKYICACVRLICACVGLILVLVGGRQPLLLYPGTYYVPDTYVPHFMIPGTYHVPDTYVPHLPLYC